MTVLHPATTLAVVMHPPPLPTATHDHRPSRTAEHVASYARSADVYPMKLTKFIKESSLNLSPGGPK